MGRGRGTKILIEPVPVQDVFISGIGRLERLGPNIRVTYYVEAECSETGMKQNVVVAKVIVPADVIPAAIQTVLDALHNIPAIGEQSITSLTN